jgi:hypothetical protein
MEEKQFVSVSCLLRELRVMLLLLLQTAMESEFVQWICMALTRHE